MPFTICFPIHILTLLFKGTDAVMNIVLYAIWSIDIIPMEPADIHYKTVIQKRNQRLVDHSDIIIGYIKRNYGGAYKAIRYARRMSKTVICIGDEIK